jgi:hypothetical protein
MWRAKRFLWAALAGVALVAGTASVVISQEKKTGIPARLDRTKNELIERSTKGVVNQTSAPNTARPLDVSKTLHIEPPVQTLVTKASAPAAATGGDQFVNPKVAPGKVRWHPTLAAACAAANKSKKPVLLFQMMGKLDDQFC